MALFKINRGSKANLPETKTEGYMYITEDVGDIYVDLSSNERIRLNAESAEKVRKITYNADGSYKSEVSLNYDDLKGIVDTYMSKNTYDTNNNGIVDNAEKVNGHTVAVDVPSNAKFTDTVYTHPTTSGNKHIPSGGSSGQILRWSADGTAAWGADNNTTYSDATTSASGLMTAAMVTKLNGIAAGATANTGTITKVQANGTDVASSGTANIPAASTSAYGVTK